MGRGKVPYVEQMEHSECGLACISMILGYYHQHTSLVKIREQFGAPRGGSSFHQLKEIAHHYGLNAKAFKGDCQSVSKEEFPILAHWEGKHYVVIEKIRKQRVTLLDPAKGRLTISTEEFNEKYSGYFLTFTPQEDFITNKKPSYLGFYLSFALENKKWLLAILFISLFLQGLGLVIPFTTQWITDSVIMQHNADFITVIGGGILIAFLFYSLFSICRGYFIARLQTLMDHSMMSKFIAHLLRLPYSFFQNRPGGELLYRANSNVMIRQILSTRLVSFLLDGILLITYACLMLWQSTRMGLIVIGLGLSIVLFLILSTRITKELTSKEINAQARVQSLLSENIHGICDVKVMGIEKKVFSSWKAGFLQQLKITEKKTIWNSFLDTITSAVQFILPLFLLWYGSLLVLSGDMTTGQLLGFNALATVFIVPLVSIGSGYTDLLYLVSYVQRIYDVFESEPEQKPLSSQEKSEIKGEIVLKNVSFQYDYFSKPVVKNINLTIQPHEKIAIVGPSGSGKSTIAKLILGLHQPTEGDIFIDGTPISELDTGFIRDRIGAVLQETRLFNQSIAENIMFHKIDELNEEDYKKIITTAKMANIHRDIMNTSLGYHTILSESGVNFSGGQRQRLLLARALINDPAILILDEATSSLDVISEKRIQQTIADINTTQIIIAHRLSTIKDVDRIIVIEDGMIKEEGSHEALLKQKGAYYNLYQTQARKADHTLGVAL